MTFCYSGNHSFTSGIKFLVGHFFLVSGQLLQSSIFLEFLIPWRNGTQQFSKLLLSKDLAATLAFLPLQLFCLQVYLQTAYLDAAIVMVCDDYFSNYD